MAHFKNKYDGMNQSNHNWVCTTCHAVHSKKQLSLKKRPTVCIVCNVERTFFHFASNAELKRFNELVLQQKVGMIANLATQVPYPVLINGIQVFKYIADFVYTKNGRKIIEDVKGNKKILTDVFVLKKKVIEAKYGVKIEIIER